MDSKKAEKTNSLRPLEPLGYRDINYFLSEFVDNKNALTLAYEKIDEWTSTHGKYICQRFNISQSTI